MFDLLSHVRPDDFPSGPSKRDLQRIEEAQKEDCLYKTPAMEYIPEIRSRLWRLVMTTFEGLQKSSADKATKEQDQERALISMSSLMKFLEDAGLFYLMRKIGDGIEATFGLL